jgi:hypothetical protein
VVLGTPLGIFYKFGILPLWQILYAPVQWYHGTSVLGEIIPSIPWIKSPINLIVNFISDLKLETLYFINGYTGTTPFLWVDYLVNPIPSVIDLPIHEHHFESPWATEPGEPRSEFVEGSSTDSEFNRYYSSPEGGLTPTPSSPVDDEWLIIEPVPDSYLSRFQNIIYRHSVFFWMIGSGISYQLVMMVAPPIIGAGMNLIAQ